MEALANIRDAMPKAVFLYANRNPGTQPRTVRELYFNELSRCLADDLILPIRAAWRR